MTSAADMLLAFDDELKGAKVDLAKTFDGRFVAKAAAGEVSPEIAAPAFIPRPPHRHSLNSLKRRVPGGAPHEAGAFHAPLRRASTRFMAPFRFVLHRIRDTLPLP
jgi:hypothetical protein